MEEVVRGVLQMDPVYVDAARIDFFVGGLRSRLGDDMNFQSLPNELVREILHVRADASNNSGRILPRQHHDAHHANYKVRRWS